ncbi:hypothetical protein [Endozoicomonas sp. 4G]|uniref:hypothetical protein n=1 Tax=Endozoicomonas sp. 4G TaxID=2872754 RepID=UPI0020789894|nr:hypothetical protein [Endozoicomonas sp. 4G]
MFKIKSLLSEFSHYSGSYLFISFSLVFSLSSEIAYSAPPVKNSAGSVTFSGEAPELPGTEELGATGITTSDATENTTALGTPFAGLAITVTLPSSESASQSTETTDPTPSAANGASNAALSGQHPMLPECSDLPDEDVDSDCQAHFSVLLSELDSDPADGTNDTFPALDLVHPSLQEIEPSNVSPNDALLIIETSPADYTIIDIYYVLWFIAKRNGEQILMKLLRLNAIILKRHLNLHKNAVFHKLAGLSIPKVVLLGGLASLRRELRQANSNREIVVIMTQFVFHKLYESVHSQVAEACEKEGGFHGPMATHTLTFLYELDQISSQLFDGKNYVVPNDIAYARSRAWFFIFGQFGHRKPMPQQVYDQISWQAPDPRILEDLTRSSRHNRNLYSAHNSLTSLFTLFLGDSDMAYKMLKSLSRSNHHFDRGYYPSPDVDSIVRWVVDGNLCMFDPSERDRIIRALSKMVRNPFPPSPLHRTPETIRSAGNPEVLEALKKELLRVNSE